MYRPGVMLLLSQTPDKFPDCLSSLGICCTRNYDTICKQRVGCNKDHACFEHLQVFSVNSYALCLINNIGYFIPENTVHYDTRRGSYT